MNPLAQILNHNKLNGENYIDWKRNIDIVLTAENLKWVFNKPFLDEPFECITDEETKKYDKWKRDDELSSCCILGSMENVLQQQHCSMVTTDDMMYNVADMFAEQGCQAHQEALWKIMNIRMKPGTPVRAYMMEVLAILNELEI